MFDADASHAAVVAMMKLAPVIPVLTVRDVADGVAQARALVAGGLSADRGDAAHAGGAGGHRGDRQARSGRPCRRRHDRRAAADRGGGRRPARDFWSAPAPRRRSPKPPAQAPIPFLPGVATPSEAMALRALGFRALKLFPAEAVGGARLLASIARAAARSRVLPDRRHRRRRRRRAISRCRMCYASAAPGCCPRRRWRRAITPGRSAREATLAALKGSRH